MTQYSGIWTTTQQLNAKADDNWPAPPPPAVQISRSLRFNSADSTNLLRTPGSAGNRKTWTWSGWVKRTQLQPSDYQALFSAYTGGAGNDGIFFRNDALSVSFGYTGTGKECYTTAVFRDVASWYHIVVICDTTQSTSSDRLKIYVNNVLFSLNQYPDLNQEGAVNLANLHNLGRWYNGSSTYYLFDGYMADVHFIDGTALGPDSFGEFNTTTGVWTPIEYTGSYGTNGFYLNFADNSSTTALGYDVSGNSNNWTPNNFSVTAGAGNDSLVDTPTPYGTDTGAGGEVRGNYCTLNPLTNGSYVTLSNGNLTAAGNTATDNGNYRGTVNFKTGKWYMEATCTVYGSINNPRYGIIPTTNATTGTNAGTDSVGKVTNSVAYWADGTKEIAGSNTSYGSSFTNGDIIGIAIDADNGAIYFSKNGTWQNSGVPTSGASKTNAAFTWTGGSIDYVIAGSEYNAGKSDWNFGQRPFAYTAPSGFKALCTTNLPEPDVVQGDTAFNTITYTGNNSQSVTGVGFQPDLVWVKSRSSGVYNHQLHDAVRGATAGMLASNSTAAQDSLYQFDSFDADGFTTDSGNVTGVNNSGQTFVAWNWKGGGSGVSNTDGSITSTVSANPTAGISVVGYAGNSSTNQTVGHGLGAAPSFIMIKNRDFTWDWIVYHKSIGATQFLILNTSDNATTSSNPFNNTAPTSSVFTIAGNSGNTYVNYSGANYVAYCFAPVEGFSAFGSYTGNGSTDGPFIYTGFRPAFVLWKETSTSSYWWRIHDAKRNVYNVTDLTLYPSDASAEATNADQMDFLSNGFKVRTDDSGDNRNTSVFIYMAFAENPFKYSLAR